MEAGPFSAAVTAAAPAVGNVADERPEHPGHVRDASDVVACPDCDAIQAVATADRWSCRRCGAVLAAARQPLDEPPESLALSVAALLMFVAAVCLPLATLHGQGRPVEVTVLGAARALSDQRMPLLGALVLLTALVLPAVRLTSAVYLLVGRRLGVTIGVLRSVRGVLASTRAWAQAEILLLGVVVALVKLTTVFTVRPGGGLLAMLAVLALQWRVSRSWDRGLA